VNRGDSQPAAPLFDDTGEKIVHDVGFAANLGFERRNGARDEAEKVAFAREIREIRKDGDSAVSGTIRDRFSSADISETPRSVMVEMRDEIDRLVARILSVGGYDEEAADLLLGIGDDALTELVKHFPGPLLWDRYQGLGKLPPVAEHGPLLKTLLKFDKKVVPHILPLFDSLDSGVRFYATYLFSELCYPEVLGSLTARVFDNDRQVRALAIVVLRKFNNFSEYHWAMHELTGAVESANASLDTKRIVAAAIGDLCEPSAVGALIRMLGADDSILVDRCHKALVKITFSDFGFSEKRWAFWWDVHREQHRIEWAIEAMTHGKAQIRSAALQALVKYVGAAVDWPGADPTPRECQHLQDQLLAWWKHEGRTLYPHREED
jgi:HEAT repeat protein